MPLEILLYIINCPPSSSALACCLTCKHLKYLIGASHFLRVSSSADETVELLHLPALNLQHQIPGLPCKRLQRSFRRNNSITYSTGSETRKYDSLPLPAWSVYLGTGTAIVRGIFELFGSTALKIAIKINHQYSKCTELLHMILIKTVQAISWTGYVRQTRGECRFVQARLLHRRQRLYISIQLHLAEYCTGVKDKLCPHARF